MSCTCGCCDGLHAVTPAAVVNRPGLGAVRTRIGTQTSFLETMLARLSSADTPELAGLKTREAGDASVAMLDAWATVADVLTFYQERIANEGYLRTATERRSLIELARLVGYAPRPGVAASVFLAFALENDAAPVVIPKGTRSNSVPGPGETMQAFETSDALPARVEWNAIRPRLVEPQTLETIAGRGLYLKGTATGLKPGDMILYGIATALTPAYVATVEVDETAKRTHLTLVRPPQPVKAAAPLRVDVLNAKSFAALLAPMALAPRGAAQLPRSVATSFQARSDALPRLLASFEPRLARSLYPALRNAPPAVDQTIQVYAMRVAARAFGYNAPLKLDTVGNAQVPPRFKEWDLSGDQAAHGRTQISLDNDYEVAADTRVVIERSGEAPFYLSGDADNPLTLTHQALAAFGMSGKSLTISWKNDHFYWLPSDLDTDANIFKAIRSARVHLGSERLALADAPLAATVEIKGDSIELDGLYDGLDPGRWLIVEGERADILDSANRPIPGIRATELVMLASVEQVIRGDGDPARGEKESLGVTFTPAGGLVQAGSPQAGDTYHTVITLAATAADGTAGLAYAYKPETVTIYANVAHATHGETRTETLGSGNAAQPLQAFTLRQPPLTYVPARTPTGVASTLEVRVNDVLWHEAGAMAPLGPFDRKFVTRTGDDDRVAVIFGNGRQGMRLPTGRENVTARYRNGIGAPGNVAARQISLLATRPLGVKGVVNPMRASGGADHEGMEAIRRNAPIALMALDRLLSTSDYADFARAFGGVGKAAAWRTATGVEVVIAGVDDAPIDESSDLFGNLKDALHRFGDPMVPLTLKVREQLSLVVSAGVRIDPDYLWEKVEPRIRAAMLAAFAFDAQDIGAPVFLSHAFRAIQKVSGVTSVDIDVFDMISADKLVGDAAAQIAGQLVAARPRLDPGAEQIAYLSPAVSDTLILQELKP